MQIGGRFLLRAILRRYPSDPSYLFRKRLTREQVERYRLSENERDEFLAQELPDFMTAPVADLTDEQKQTVRNLFYENTNMNSASLRRWMGDPRVGDGVSQDHVLRRHQLRAVKRQLAGLLQLQAQGGAGGEGWSDTNYKIARKSIFVSQNLFNRRFIDYETWVILMNYGRDWEKPLGYYRLRRLPPLVELEAQLALLRHKNPGTPMGAL